MDEIYFDSLSIDTVEHNSQTQALTELRIGDQDIMCKLDTGAEGNVMPFSTWRKINPRSRKRPDGVRMIVRMIAYGGSVIRQIGTCTLQVRYTGNEHSSVFYVTDTTGPALIGLPSCCELGLVKLQYAIGYTIPHSNQEMRNWILHEYGDVFKGIGRFSGEYHIEVDTSVPPVIHPPCRVPHALRKPLRQELNSLVEKGILRQVTKATSWVNSFCSIIYSIDVYLLCDLGLDLE